MVQFNLLPDVKIDYLKTQRTKRTVMLASLTLTGLSIFIVVLLFLIVNVFQKQHISHLDNDIKTRTQALKDVPDLDKVLTVQNQLDHLTATHESKPAASRTYGYLIQLTPSDAKISDVNIDFATNTIAINGSAGSLGTINRFTDILKFTDYKVDGVSEKAFSQVVLSSFGVSAGKQGGDRTTYAITAQFNPEIFNNTKNVELVVPDIISTRSVTETPTDLFEAKSTGGTQ